MYDLRLSQDDFWNLTPAIFMALCEREEQRRMLSERIPAHIAAFTYNANRKKGTKAKDAEDFMSAKPKRKKKSMSGDTMLAYVQNVLHPYFTELAKCQQQSQTSSSTSEQESESL